MAPRHSPRRSRRPSRPPTGVRGRPSIEQVERRLLMASSSALANTQGVLDPSFNNFGALSIAAPGNSTVRTSLVAVQPDERVVVGGIYVSGSTAVTEILRYTAQGFIDPTFNGGQPVTLGYSAISLSVEPNGQIIVAGAGLTQINANGTLDTAFGSGGTVALTVPLAGVVVQSDNKILISGDNSTTNLPQVTRYNTDGTVDTSYGTNGTATLNIPSVGGSSYVAGSVSLSAAGEALVSIAVHGNTSLATFGLVELTTSGGFDQSFGIGGVSELQGYAGVSSVGGMAVASDGTVYQVGTYGYGSATGVGYLMAYSGNGKYADISPMGGLDTFASNVTLAADNKPVVIGTAVQGSGASAHTVIAVDRFFSVNPISPVFKPDATFGGTGLVTVAYQGVNSADSTTVGDLGFAGYEMPNGNIVIGGVSVNGGSTTTTFNVTRLVGDGMLAGSVGTITGTTYFDNNFNGVRDAGDAGLAGFSVFLDTNNNGVLDAGEEQVFTDATGRYTFNGLPRGVTYNVVQTVPAGYTHVTPAAGVTESFSVPVTAGSTVALKDFGLTGTDTLSGTVYHDTNGDRVQDNGEAGFSGVTVFLDLNGDGALTSADTSYSTDSSGNFIFTHLTPNTYLVRIVPPTGSTITTPATLPTSVTIVGNNSSIGTTFGLN